MCHNTSQGQLSDLLPTDSQHRDHLSEHLTCLEHKRYCCNNPRSEERKRRALLQVRTSPLGAELPISAELPPAAGCRKNSNASSMSLCLPQNQFGRPACARPFCRPKAIGITSCMAGSGLAVMQSACPSPTSLVRLKTSFWPLQ